MAIRFSSRAPTDGHQRIQDELPRDRAARSRGSLESLGPRPSLAAGPGIETWVLGLDQAAAGALDQVRQNDWRFLLFENDEVIGEAHVQPNDERSEAFATGYGPFVSGLLRALSTAGELPIAHTHEVEPRALLVPGLGFAALWLHVTEGEDVVIPVAPSPPLLPLQAPASWSDLATTLRAAAARKLEKLAAAPGASGGSGGSPPKSPVEPRVSSPSFMQLTPLAPSSPEPSLESFAPQVSQGRQLSFVMQDQQIEEWCWAAVATSVGLFLDTGDWTQCKTASYCLDEPGCCSDEEPCAQAGYLHEALRFTESLDDWDDEQPDLETIEDMIDEGRPLCVRIEWFGSGAHFVAITGYSTSTSGERMLTIQDSQFGPKTIRHSRFPSSYRGGGDWTHTYYCKARRDDRP